MRPASKAGKSSVHVRAVAANCARGVKKETASAAKHTKVPTITQNHPSRRRKTEAASAVVSRGQDSCVRRRNNKRPTGARISGQLMRNAPSASRLVLNCTQVSELKTFT